MNPPDEESPGILGEKVFFLEPGNVPSSEIFIPKDRPYGSE